MKPPSLRLIVTLATAGLALAALGAARTAQNRRRHHPPDSAPGRTARREWFGDYIVTGRSITIAAPRSRLFAMWQNPEDMPRFMEGVRSVTRDGDGTFRWVIAGPAGAEVKLHTRIIEDRPDDFIAWRSVEGSEIDAEGKVMFRDAPANRGTVVEAIIAYKPPGGTVGHWIGKLFRSDPAAQGRHELKRLKMLVETGEIATAANRKEDRDARADVPRQG